MIDPKTLRIGNWIQHNGRKRVIEEIGRFGIDLYSDADGKVYAQIPFEELEPVDIFPELLLDFGFQEYSGSPHGINDSKEWEGKEIFRGSNYRKMIETEHGTFFFESVFSLGWLFQGIRLPRQPIEFHDLQNQFFYLTNVELELPKFG